MHVSLPRFRRRSQWKQAGRSSIPDVPWSTKLSERGPADCPKRAFLVCLRRSPCLVRAENLRQPKVRGHVSQREDRRRRREEPAIYIAFSQSFV